MFGFTIIYKVFINSLKYFIFPSSNFYEIKIIIDKLRGQSFR